MVSSEVRAEKPLPVHPCSLCLDIIRVPRPDPRRKSKDRARVLPRKFERLCLAFYLCSHDAFPKTFSDGLRDGTLDGHHPRMQAIGRKWQEHGGWQGPCVADQHRGVLLDTGRKQALRMAYALMVKYKHANVLDRHGFRIKALPLYDHLALIQAKPGRT